MENKRILSLDGLRAVAILLVLMSHFWMYSVSHDGLNRFFQSGWTGVDLFFVLSGYLITSILLKTRDRPTYFRTFYLRRTLRIFPPYYALLIIVFVALPLVRPVEQRLREDGWMFWLYIGNFLFAAHGWQSMRALNLTWSLAIEEQFYLLWPALVRLVNRHFGAVCIALCILLPALRFALWDAHVGWMWLHVMMPLRADSFAWGALVALYPRRFAWASALIIPIAILTGMREYYQPGEIVGTIGYSLNAACAAGLISLALRDGPFARTLSFRPLRYIGEVSYGIYLYHALTFLAVTHVVHFHHTVAGGFEQVVVVSAISVGVAAISYHFFEQPILKLKNKISIAAPRPAMR
ncbi:MAG: acyltransferase family protein [Steroidobacteraceae bacterium]